MEKFFNPNKCIQYIGIAANEPKRFGQLSESLKSPLVMYGIDENECYVICKKIGLLAPNYLQSKRSGCWFCHAQPIEQLRLLRKNHPDLWNKLLEWDHASPIPFRHGERHGVHTVSDFDLRFLLEDQGIIQAGDKRFRWALIEEYKQFQQLRIEEFML